LLARQIRQYIIKPVLELTNLYSPSYDILVYGTGWVESGYEAIVQAGNPKNGGLGFFQDEPSDYKDIGIWLKNGFNKDMLSKVLAACNYDVWPMDPMVLMSDIKLATLCCRIHYHRIKQSIPAATDAKGMAEYHKQYYNSGGKADVDKNTIVFQRIINNEL